MSDWNLADLWNTIADAQPDVRHWLDQLTPGVFPYRPPADLISRS